MPGGPQPFNDRLQVHWKNHASLCFAHSFSAWNSKKTCCFLICMDFHGGVASKIWRGFKYGICWNDGNSKNKNWYGICWLTWLVHIFVFHLLTGHDTVYAESGQGNLEHSLLSGSQPSKWECSTLCLAYRDCFFATKPKTFKGSMNLPKLSCVSCLVKNQIVLHQNCIIIFSYYFNPFPNLCLRACNSHHSRGPFNGYSHPSGRDPFPEAPGLNIPF